MADEKNTDVKATSEELNDEALKRNERRVRDPQQIYHVVHQVP